MAGHFYDEECKQHTEVLCQDGITVRDADARDAKKNRWGVGVTTVLSIPQKYHLQNWIIDQHLNSALNYNSPRQVHGNLEYPSYKKDCEEWKEKIKKQAKIEQERTSRKGKQIHKEFENYFTRSDAMQTELFLDFVEPVLDSIVDKFGMLDGIGLDKLIGEQTFYHPAGFGGTVDLHSKELGIILDFKTKDKDAENWGDVRLYDEHYMQLEAYRIGLKMPESTRMFIVFISQVTPGLHEIRELTQGKNGEFDRKKLDRAGRMFEKLLHYWQHAHDMPIKDVALYE